MDAELRQANSQDLAAFRALVGACHEFENIHRSASARESALRRLLSDRTPGGIWLIYTDQRLAGCNALCCGFSIEFGGFDAFTDEFYWNRRFVGEVSVARCC